MTRIEEATNKIVEFIDIVKDVPKNESILAIGLDMVEWADKTMLDNVCDLIVSGKVYWILKGDKEALAELIRNEFKK